MFALIVGSLCATAEPLHRHSILASGKHEVVILSRSNQPHLSARGIEVRMIDYKDHAGLVRALEDVEVVISTVSSFGDAFWTSQLALLQAAKEAGVKRFAPSEFGCSVGAFSSPKHAIGLTRQGDRTLTV